MSAITPLIAELGKQIGFEGFTLDENNATSLQFDDVIVSLEYVPEDNALFLFTKVAPLPKDNTLNVYSVLLSANSLFRGTGGGVIGIEKTHDAITFANKVDISATTVGTILTVLERHVNAVEALRIELQALNEAPGEKTEDELLVTGEMLRI